VQGVQDGSPHASEFGLFTELDDETFQGGSSAYSAPTCSVGVNKVILGDIIVCALVMGSQNRLNIINTQFMRGLHGESTYVLRLSS
jgi:hypothetical protein